jgi:3',5'-cyclic AMP phosphodiesterase CpdA
MQQAVQSVLGLNQPAHAVVITGDLVDFGRADEYAHLRSLIEPLHMPVYLLPGNHDDRDALRAAFADHAYLPRSGPIQYTVNLGPIDLVAIDTLAPQKSHGSLCAERLQWLEQQLGAGHKPVIIAMHHPPFATAIGHMDRIGLLEGQAQFARIVRMHTHRIARIICGHLHRNIDVVFEGTMASTCGSPAHQVDLDLSSDAASAFRLEPPSFKLHVWHGDTGLVSHTALIGKYDGPFPFHDENGLID